MISVRPGNCPLRTCLAVSVIGQRPVSVGCHAGPVSDGQASDPNAVGLAVRQLLGDSLGYLHAAALRVVARFGIADLLAEGPRTVRDLAETAGVAAGPLARVLRLLGTRGIFRVDDTDTVHLTTAAGLLRTDSPLPLRPAVLLFTDQLYWLPAGQLAEAVQA